MPIGPLLGIPNQAPHTPTPLGFSDARRQVEDELNEKTGPQGAGSDGLRGFSGGF